MNDHGNTGNKNKSNELHALKPRTNKFFNSVASVFSMFIIMIILISFLVTGIAITNRITSNIKDSTLENTLQILNQNKSYIGLITDTLQNYYRQLQSDTNFVRLVTGEYETDVEREVSLSFGRRTLEAMRKSNDYIKNIIYVNTEGLSMGVPHFKYLTRSEEELYDKYYYDLAWSDESVFYWYPVAEHSIYSEDEPSILMIKSFRESLELKETGIVIFSIEPEIFQSLMKDAILGEDDEIYILNHEGIVISHNDIEMFGITNERFKRLIKSIEHNERAHESNLKTALELDEFTKYEEFKKEAYQFFEQKDEKSRERKLFMYSILPDNNWFIIKEIPYDDLTKESRRIIQYIIAVIIVVSLISIPISIQITFWITKPIKDIVSVMTRFEKGDRKVRITEKYPYEFSRLKDSFNNMAEQIDIDFVRIKNQMNVIERISYELRNRETELLELNENLENRVKERTLELEQKNKDLEEYILKLKQTQAELLATKEELEMSIDDLHSTQKQLVESEKQSAVGFLIANIAHEISTPVGNCITSSTFVESELKRTINLFEEEKLKKSELESFLAEMITTVELIVNELKKTTNIITGFKSLSVTTGAQEKRVFDLCSHLKDILRVYKDDFETQSIDMRFTCEDEIILSSYQGLMYQLFDILIGNILQHAFEENTDKRVDINIFKDKTDIVIVFKDNGIGIPQNQISTVFDTRLSNRHSRSGKGFGLQVAHNIVKSILMGEINIISNKGEGTEFRIIIPSESK